MNELEKQTTFEAYNGKTHRLGKIFLTAGLVMFLVAPFIMGFYLNAMPDIPAFAKALAQIAIIYIPSCVVEFLIYTPMLVWAAVTSASSPATSPICVFPA